jgi:acyl-homoserine lactone acylase PvdQ
MVRKGIRRFLAVLSALVLGALLLFPAPSGASPDPRYRDFDDPGGFMNILPPGQDGGVNGVEMLRFQLTKKYPKHFNDQTDMYNSLAHDAPGIEDRDLTKYFKDASFGVKGKIERSYSPTKGATILRDEYGVPHIFGETREATMFAVGYATAEDRLFLMDVLRHLGRGRVSEFLGASERNKEMDRAQLKIAPYKESELTDQVNDICDSGPEGAQACLDAQAYIRGINAYIKKAYLDPRLMPAEYPLLQQVPKPFVKEDIVAIASLVGGIFGMGGGNEVASGTFLQELQQKYGGKKGRALWEAFRSANDAEAPVTVKKPFPYNNHRPTDPRSTALLDLETADQALRQMDKPDMILDGPKGPIRLTPPKGNSNALLVAGKHTRDGRPIAVFGPQTGYFSPQLLVEMDVHGPGIDARGVAFAGVNLYVQLGRGKNYAWSATSSGADNVDQWVVKLCEPDGSRPTKKSKHYWYKGKCRPMDIYRHRQIAKPTAAGLPDKPSLKNIIFDIRVERTVYGPVVARGTVKGEPVAVTVQRSTYGRELASAIGFQRVNNPEFMKDGARSFLKAFDGVEYAFNWFYTDEKDIAYKHTCLCPVRDPRTDPDLPSWGTGEYDWTGQFLRPKQQPQAINPPQGYLANWNNKQAPKFRSNDANFNYGPIHRSLFLEKRIREAVSSGKKLTRSDAVNLVMDAATVDLKGQEVYPLVLRVLGSEAPGGDPVLQRMRDRLEEWVNSGGHRRDRNPRDGKYDHAVAVAIGDAYFETLVEAIFGDTLQGTHLPNPLEDSPRSGQGSAYMEGYYAYVHKDLRQVLGDPVRDPWPKTHCGEGDLGDCRDRLWQALKEAADKLTEEYGSPDPDDWKYDAARDHIKQTPVGLIAAPDMQWVNRPTFQQVVQVGIE